MLSTTLTAHKPSTCSPEGYLLPFMSVTIRAQTVSACLLTGYDYGIPKASSYISHGQLSQSA